MLGGEEADGIGQAPGSGLEAGPSADDAERDKALERALRRQATARAWARRAPRVARWLGDIRTYFPSSVVQVMQPDAMERLGLHQLLLEPELLEAVEPDIGIWCRR